MIRKQINQVEVFCYQTFNEIFLNYSGELSVHANILIDKFFCL